MHMILKVITFIVFGGTLDRDLEVVVGGFVREDNPP